MHRIAKLSSQGLHSRMQRAALHSLSRSFSTKASDKHSHAHSHPQSHAHAQSHAQSHKADHAHPRAPHDQPKQPASILVPAVGKFKLVDTTLREGEQFATAEFSSQDRAYIAKILDSIGVDYIELVNPLASKQAIKDCEDIAKMGLRSKIVTHTRCHMDDVRVACETGIDGVNLYMATSPILSKHSHGKGIDEVIEIAGEVIEYVKSKKMEVRFSCEDSFRSDKSDLLKIYSAMDKLGVQRVGIADTVGIATPIEVYETVKLVRSVLRPTTEVEFHTHNDTGCCIANAFTALQGGATHIDTCVLGIGERNGITPLGGFLARMYTIDQNYVKSKYDLSLIYHLEKFVAQRSHITIPFNNYVTGSSAFTHKAGVHSKAVMSNAASYEVIDPKDFGVSRKIQLAHRLTGWNAIKQRSKDLGLDNLTDEQIKAATVSIKNLSDTRSVSVEEVDAILLKLATGPVESAFVTWDAAGEDLKSKKSHAERAVEQALESLEPAKVDMRPTSTVVVKGHLFDKAVLNRLLDLIVDSSCDFKVVHLEVASNNAAHSSAYIQLWGDTDDDVVRVKTQLQSMVQGLNPVAECTMADYDPHHHGPHGATHHHKATANKKA